MPPRPTRAMLIDAPAGAVWDLLVDTRTWPVWGPSVRAVECDPPRIAAGVAGRVQTVLGLWLPFRVTRFEEGRSWSWEVAHVPATGHRVVPVGTVTRVEFDVPWPAAPYTLVLGAGLDRLRRLAEDGER